MNLRDQLVKTALEWESYTGIAPPITSAISEYDAAILCGAKPDEFIECRKGMTAVTKGYDFIWQEKRYQVKANRPSGKPGSFVTLVSKPKNLEWDYLVWVLYNRNYELEEVWQCDLKLYTEKLHNNNYLRPNHLREVAKCLFKSETIEEKPTIINKRESNMIDEKLAITKKRCTKINDMDYKLTSTQRIMLLKKILNNEVLENNYVIYDATRLTFNKEEISKLTNSDDLIVVNINPTQASLNRGYLNGYYIFSLEEFFYVFNNIVETTSYDKKGCYHIPSPPQKSEKLFVLKDQL